MTNRWIINRLGNLLAKHDTLRRSLGQMRRELIGDDFETVHLKPKMRTQFCETTHATIRV